MGVGVNKIIVLDTYNCSFGMEALAINTFASGDQATCNWRGD